MIETSIAQFSIPAVRKPSDLRSILESNSDKDLYFALKNVKFSYAQLYKYLINDLVKDGARFNRPKSEILSELMEVSESTFYRWKNNKRKADEKHAERLAELLVLFMYGEAVFENKSDFMEWLNAQNIHLEMRAPISFLDNVPGIRLIKHLLDKIEYGAPV